MPTPSGSTYPIILNGQGYELYRERLQNGRVRPAVAIGAFGPGDVGPGASVANQRDVPRIWDDFSGGGGYSRRIPTVTNGYAWCLGDARYPRGFLPAGELIEIPLPSVAEQSIPYDSFDFDAGGVVMVLAGPRAFAVPKSGAAAAIAAAFQPTGSATSAVRYGDQTYVGLTVGPMWRFDHTTAAWTPSPSAIRSWLTSVYWVVAGVGAQRVIGIDGDDALRVWPADPTLPGDPLAHTSWSAAYPVGESDALTTHLVASTDHVYVVKQDGVYDLDGRGFAPNLTPYWRAARDPANGLTACVHGNSIYASMAQGIDRLRIGSGPGRDTAEWAHPGTGLPNETPIFGRVRALAPVASEIAAAVFNGTDSYICFGSPRDQVGVQPGVGPVLWHMALTKIPGVTVTYMKVHTFGTGFEATPWLLIGGVLAADSATPKLYRLALPKASAPYQAFTQPELYGVWGSYRFAPAASITLPTDDWNDPTAVKVLRRFDLQCDNLGLEVWAELLASADGPEYVSQDISRTSPRDTLFPTEELTTGYQIGTRVELHGTPSVPPVLRALKARAEVNIEVTEQRVYQLMLGQFSEGYNRARDRRNPGVLWAQLWALQSEGPVPMRDHHGLDLLVKVEPGMSYQERELPGSRSWAMVATVTLSVLARPGYYDISLFNTDAALAGPASGAIVAAAGTPPPPIAPTEPASYRAAGYAQYARRAQPAATTNGVS